MTTEIQRIETESRSFAHQAGQVLIVDADSYSHAGTVLRQIKGIRAEINDTFAPIIQAAHNAHKEALKQKKKVDAPLSDADRVIRGRMVDWQTAEDNRRREQEAALRLVAQQQEEDRRIAEAMAAEAEGNAEEAVAILDAPPPPPPVVASAVPTVEGVHLREYWTFDVVDEAKIPREYWLVNLELIASIVRRMKMATPIAGIRPRWEMRTTVRE